MHPSKLSFVIGCFFLMIYTPNFTISSKAKIIVISVAKSSTTWTLNKGLMTGALIALIDSLTDWLIDSWTVWLIYWPINCLTGTKLHIFYPTFYKIDVLWLLDNIQHGVVCLYLTALTVRWPKVACPFSSVFWPEGVGVNYPVTKKNHLVNRLILYVLSLPSNLLT